MIILKKKNQRDFKSRYYVAFARAASPAFMSVIVVFYVLPQQSRSPCQVELIPVQRFSRESVADRVTLEIIICMDDNLWLKLHIYFCTWPWSIWFIVDVSAYISFILVCPTCIPIMGSMRIIVALSVYLTWF